VEHIEKILVIKAGSTMPSLAARRGDFEDWILAEMGVDITETAIVDVRNGALLPPYEHISGVVITGPHAIVTEHRGWSECTALWLRGAVERKIPILGICYGHQLLAYALGGEVGDNPNGLEAGMVDVHLNGAVQDDLLFAGFPSPIRGYTGHHQSVLRLPPGARLLASSAMDTHQVFVMGDCAWGVQFHPEFDADVTIEYIRRESQSLGAQGQEPERLIRGCEDTPHGPDLLRRFVAIVEERHTKTN
jgi:GMP synthase (glutamine-hydrolysing)